MGILCRSGSSVEKWRVEFVSSDDCHPVKLACQLTASNLLDASSAGKKIGRQRTHVPSLNWLSFRWWSSRRTALQCWALSCQNSSVARLNWEKSPKDGENLSFCSIALTIVISHALLKRYRFLFRKNSIAKCAKKKKNCRDRKLKNRRPKKKPMHFFYTDWEDRLNGNVICRCHLLWADNESVFTHTVANNKPNWKKSTFSSGYAD